MIDAEYYSILGELQATDFVLVELTLYLDTHPDDVTAIKQFNDFSDHKKKLKEHYECKYGPLQQYGNSPADDGWKWSESPWPWQV